MRKSEVRIEPAPGPDLEELLEDMRMQYEKLAARNKADAEQWYQEKVGWEKQWVVYGYVYTCQDFVRDYSENPFAEIQAAKF